MKTQRQRAAWPEGTATPLVLVVAENGDVGGVGRYCVDVASGFIPDAHVACLCPIVCSELDPCWLAGQCAARRVPLHRIRMPPKGWRSGFRGMVGLWRRTGRPIVHVNGRRGNSIAMVARLVVPAFRYVSSVHGVLGLHRRRNAVYRIIDVGASYLAAAVISVSDHGRRAMVRAGSPKKRTLTIPVGLAEPDMERLRRVAAHREDRRAADGPTRLGFLGRLSPEKGTRELLEVAEILEAAHVDVTLDIAGDGPDRERMRAESGALTSAGFVRWRGPVLDVAEYLGGIDVLLMPSHNEGMPYVVLEAMAAGCAVVAFAVGGIPEIIDRPGVGVLVRPGDVQGFATAVIELALDPARTAAIGSAAAAHVEGKFVLADRLEEIRLVYAQVQS